VTRTGKFKKCGKCTTMVKNASDVFLIKLIFKTYKTPK
jgi:predicted PP-loop superfamily ATPase